MCDYTKAAQKYKPGKIKCLFVAESPPAYKSADNKSYFYREQIIKNQIPNFISRLNSLKVKNSTGIIIIKKLNYDILTPVLSRHGFTVLNKEKIGFPKYYWDRDTVKGVRFCIKKIKKP